LVGEINTSGAVNSLNVDVVLQILRSNAVKAELNSIVSQAVKGAKTIDDSNKKTISSYEKLLKTMNTIRWSMVDAAFVTAAIVVPVYKAMQAYSEFGMKVARVAAISGESTDTIYANMKKLQDGSIYTLNEVADAYIQFVKLGFSASDATDAMSSITKFATVAFTDLSTAVNITGQILYQFGIDASQTSAVVNIIAGAANASAADVETFGVALSYVGGTAASLNLGLEDTSAALAVLINQGVKSSRAGTSLNAALTAMASPTAKAEGYMNQLGISFFDSSGNIKDFESQVRDLSGALSGLSDESTLKVLDSIFGTRGGRSIRALLTQYENTGSAIEGMKEQMKEAGNVSNLNMIITNNNAAKTLSMIQRMKSAWTSFNYSVGEAMGKMNAYGDKTVMGSVYGTGFSPDYKKAEDAAKSYFNEINNLDKLSVQQRSDLYDSFTSESTKKFREMTKDAVLPTDTAERQIVLQELFNKAMQLTIDESNKTVELTQDEKDALKDAVEEAKILKDEVNSTNFSNFMSGFNSKVYSSLVVSLKSISDEYKEFINQMNADSGITKEQIDLNKILDESEAKQSYFLEEVSRATEYYNNKINLLNYDLADYKESLSDVNDEISKLINMRFEGQTNAEKFISDYSYYLKEQKLATYGITDAQSWLNEQVSEGVGGFEDLGTAINIVNDATSSSASSYEAWQDTVNQFIESSINAGNKLGTDVSSSIKKYQTLLMSTSKYSEDSTNSQVSYGDLLSDAYDVTYGKMKSNVDYFVQSQEDASNGVASSSTSIINSLSGLYESQGNYESKMESVNEVIKDYQDKIDSITKSSLDFKTSIEENEIATLEKDIKAWKKLSKEILIANSMRDYYATNNPIATIPSLPTTEPGLNQDFLNNVKQLETSTRNNASNAITFGDIIVQNVANGNGEDVGNDILSTITLKLNNYNKTGAGNNVSVKKSVLIVE